MSGRRHLFSVLDWPACSREAADRLTEHDAMRPPCPTCGGTTRVDGPCGDDDCPDCVDGKVSIEQLAATWRAVWSDEMTYTTGKWSRADVIVHLRAVRP